MNRASIESQLGNMPSRIKDTEEIAALRESGDWQRLGNALVGQYRFKEAIGAYERALYNTPEDANLWRSYAGANLTVGNFSAAVSAYRRCMTLYADVSDIAFSMGYASYLQKRYTEADVHFSASIPNDDEQKIMVIYWHTLAASRGGIRKKLLERYNDDMHIEQNLAYETAVRLFAGKISAAEAEAWMNEQQSEMDRIIVLYGLVIYYEAMGMLKERERALHALLAHDEHWPSLPYLAAWRDDAHA